MNLEHLGRQDSLLSELLKQAEKWRRLDAAVKKLLPLNLHPHFQTACIEDGELVLLAANNMAASRLKMIAPSVLPQLAGLDASIRSVSVRLVPKPEKPPKTNTLHLSKAALESFGSAAAKLEKRHPELAAALAELVRKHGA
ncbi:DciA family protein [Neisseria polysaccharea]|uniref:DciA family protein n=1 Tax=Neisseria polysaccharea TaxID=489 RepID=UPI0027E1B8C3|nr:DciA family protein [Neisseria polysaccharea]